MHINDMTLERCLMVEVHIHCVCSSDKFGACFYISMLERRVCVCECVVNISEHTFPMCPFAPPAFDGRVCRLMTVSRVYLLSHAESPISPLAHRFCVHQHQTPERGVAEGHGRACDLHHNSQRWNITQDETEPDKKQEANYYE